MQEYIPVYLEGDEGVPYGSVRPVELKDLPTPAVPTAGVLTPFSAAWHRDFIARERQIRFEVHNSVLRVIANSREVAEKLAGFRRSPLHPSWKPAR